MSDEIAGIAEHFTRSWYGDITKLARAYQAQRTQLAEAESRALLAVAREAELTEALEAAHKLAHSDGMGMHHEADLCVICIDALSSTSPRAKQLLAIKAAARKGRPVHPPIDETVELRFPSYNDAAEFVAALTTQPVDENTNAR